MYRPAGSEIPRHQPLSRRERGESRPIPCPASVKWSCQWGKEILRTRRSTYTSDGEGAGTGKPPGTRPWPHGPALLTFRLRTTRTRGIGPQAPRYWPDGHTSNTTTPTGEVSTSAPRSARAPMRTDARRCAASRHRGGEAGEAGEGLDQRLAPSRRLGGSSSRRPRGTRCQARFAPVRARFARPSTGGAAERRWAQAGRWATEIVWNAQN